MPKTNGKALGATTGHQEASLSVPLSQIPPTAYMLVPAQDKVFHVPLL